MGEKHEIRVFLNNFSYKNPIYKDDKNGYGWTISVSGIGLVKKK
jgi:hypothetical protein